MVRLPLCVCVCCVFLLRSGLVRSWLKYFVLPDINVRHIVTYVIWSFMSFMVDDSVLLLMPNEILIAAASNENSVALFKHHD